MKKLITSFLLLALTAACKVENKKSEIRNQTNDKIITSYFENSDTTNRIMKKFRIDNTNLEKLPKNKEMILELTYKGEFSTLVKETDAFVLSKNNDCSVTKINNSTFKVKINADMNEQILHLDFYIAPKKNNVLIDKQHNEKYENQAKWKASELLEIVE